MALDYTVVYPGQLDPANPSDYPYGEARNITVPGDGTGWPLERRWVNDLLGFEQSLLTAAGIVPSGLPDRVGNSQYLTALENIIEAHDFTTLDAFDVNAINGVNLASGATLTVDTGAHIQCDGTSEFTGLATFTFPVALTGGFTSGGASTFNGSATFNGTGVGLKVTTQSELDGAVLLGGLLTAGAGIIVGTAGVLVGGGGGVLVTGSTHLQGPTELSDPVTLTGDGHIRKRVVDAPDSNATFSISDADEVHVLNNLSSGRTYTLATTGAQDGASFRAVTYEPDFAITFGGLLMQANTAGATWAATWTFKSGAWRLVDTSFIAP